MTKIPVVQISELQLHLLVQKGLIIAERRKAQGVRAAGRPSVEIVDPAKDDLPVGDSVSAQVVSQLHHVIREEGRLLTVIDLLAECAPLCGQ